MGTQPDCPEEASVMQVEPEPQSKPGVQGYVQNQALPGVPVKSAEQRVAEPSGPADAHWPPMGLQ